MNQNIFQELSEELGQIQQLMDFFAEEHEVSQIDIDIVLQRMREIYENLLKLRIQGQETSDSQAQGMPADIPANNPPKQENMPVKEPVEETQTFEVKEIPEDKGASKEEVEEPAVKNTPPKQAKAEEQKIEAKPKEEKTRSFNDWMSGNKQSGILEKINQQPIKSIESSIGLGDKFRMINELFHGNAEEYKSIVQQLDAAGDYSSANEILQIKYEWEEDNEMAQLLHQLVKRKYIHRHG